MCPRCLLDHIYVSTSSRCLLPSRLALNPFRVNELLFVQARARTSRGVASLLLSGLQTGDDTPVPAHCEVGAHVIRKKRCTFTIEPEMLERLRSMKARTGMSESEQIRQAIRSWLESREWPVGGFRKTHKNV
jgi:hypothetical protein